VHGLDSTAASDDRAVHRRPGRGPCRHDSARRRLGHRGPWLAGRTGGMTISVGGGAAAMVPWLRFLACINFLVSFFFLLHLDS
jgi:hypothetical protein